MAKSLADLRTAPPTERRTGSVRLCLRPDLVARVHALTGELAELPPTLEGEQKRERKMAEGPTLPHPRAVEIRDELDAVLSEIEDNEGEMTVAATISEGEWRRWVDAHPSRPKGEPGHDRDQRVSGGLVNADALIDALGTFAYSWNSEPLGEGDWAAIFEPAVGAGDKAEMATAVVTLYEGRTDFRQWRSALSASLQMFDASASLAHTPLAPSDSADGSPAPSSEATTETAAKSA